MKGTGSVQRIALAVRALGAAMLVIGLAACQTNGNTTIRDIESSKRSSVSATWNEATILISGSLIDYDLSYMYGKIKDERIQKHLETLNSRRDVPFIVGMHGSGGSVTSVEAFVRTFMHFGIVAVLPYGPARRKDWIDCHKGCSNPQSLVNLRRRIEEAKYAYDKLMQLSWSSKNKSVLMGFSYGGITTAVYPYDDYAARMILGWTCNSTQPDRWGSNGIRGSSRIPVFAAVSAKDAIYRGTVYGHCKVGGRSHSKSIVVPGTRHNIMGDPEVRKEAHKFLQNVFAVSIDN